MEEAKHLELSSLHPVLQGGPERGNNSTMHDDGLLAMVMVGEENIQFLHASVYMSTLQYRSKLEMI